tara:strand:+ start:176 stop:685 length:510 start_codon:yes stop_codon:yes gene_type:complete
MKTLPILLVLLFSSLAFSDSFLLKCENEKDWKSEKIKTLYFFNKASRFTGYFAETDGSEAVNIYERKCRINETTTNSYTYKCKGGKYKFSSIHNLDWHILQIGRKDLSLFRLFQTKYSPVGDSFNCKTIDIKTSKSLLKEMKGKIKIRDSEMTEAKKLRESLEARGNKI